MFSHDTGICDGLELDAIVQRVQDRMCSLTIECVLLLHRYLRRPGTGCHSLVGRGLAKSLDVFLVPRAHRVLQAASQSAAGLHTLASFAL